MNNKEQIMIDGVDVSGCKGFYIHDRSTTNIDYWMYGQCKSSKEYGCYCRNNPNCYFKQLKRSEAQCEVLFALHTALEKRYEAKEQECEELKERLDRTEELKKEWVNFEKERIVEEC